MKCMEKNETSILDINRIIEVYVGHLSLKSASVFRLFEKKTTQLPRLQRSSNVKSWTQQATRRALSTIIRLCS
jgi:hypothetical protein